MDRNVPVFVKVADYKDVLDIVDVMKQKLKDTKFSLMRIKELKDQEDQEIADWEKSMEEINRRLIFIDSAFFENE